MNKNQRFDPAPVLVPQSGCRVDVVPERIGGLSLTSSRARDRLVEALRCQGIKSEQALDVVARVPRHLFVDEAFASRAYEDSALPIGHKQTISKPFTVARFVEHALAAVEKPLKVLEIGAGCGYQAAIFAELGCQVVSVERIRALYEKARKNLNTAGYGRVNLVYGDGLEGFAQSAPFDVIVVAAAGVQVPDVLLQQLRVGGRLVVPVDRDAHQVLLTIDRQTEDHWHHEDRDLVKFVPLLKGTRAV